MGTPGAIAVDATDVYWADVAAQKVMTVPISGGTPTVVASTKALLNGFQSFAVDAGSVYWIDGTDIMKVVK
jgi:hypothetical protein